MSIGSDLLLGLIRITLKSKMKPDPRHTLVRLTFWLHASCKNCFFLYRYLNISFFSTCFQNGFKIIEFQNISKQNFLWEFLVLVFFFLHSASIDIKGYNNKGRESGRPCAWPSIKSGISLILIDQRISG
jgi:hypothetical protein